MEPTDLDILAERGSASKNHVGNARFWRLVIGFRMKYIALGKDGNEGKKNEIAEEIAQQIKDYGGHFLRRDRKVDPDWYEVDEKKCIEKIEMALREVKNIPESVQTFAQLEYPEVYKLFLQEKKRAGELALKRKADASSSSAAAKAKQRRLPSPRDGPPTKKRRRTRVVVREKNNSRTYQCPGLIQTVTLISQPLTPHAVCSDGEDARGVVIGFPRTQEEYSSHEVVSEDEEPPSSQASIPVTPERRQPIISLQETPSSDHEEWATRYRSLILPDFGCLRLDDDGSMIIDQEEGEDTDRFHCDALSQGDEIDDFIDLKDDYFRNPKDSNENSRDEFPSLNSLIGNLLQFKESIDILGDDFITEFLVE